MVEMAAERGYEGVTVRGLARLAGVSTRTFYKHFSNAEECFAATYEWLMQSSLRRAWAAWESAETWGGGIRDVLHSLVEGVAKHPKEARLVLVEAFAVGQPMQTPMAEAVSSYEQLVIESFAEASEEVAAPEQLARGIVAGAMRVVRGSLLTESRAALAELEIELGDWVLSLLPGYPVESDPTDRALRLPTTNGRRPSNGVPEEPGLSVLGAFGDERGRILAAASKLALAEGYSSLTIPMIRADAGVSRRAFDARFASVEECFLEAVEAVSTSAAERVQREAAEADRWQDRPFWAVAALCAELAHNEALARLAFVEILAPGRRGVERCEGLLTGAVEVLRRAIPAEFRPGEVAASASVGAAWRIVQASIGAGELKALPALAPLLAYVLLAPVMGSERASSAVREARAISPSVPPRIAVS